MNSMVRLKRLGLILLTALLLALPAWAQALWGDEDFVPASGGTLNNLTVHIDAAREVSSTVALTFNTTGPTVTLPVTVTIPAGETSVIYSATFAAGQAGDVVTINMTDDLLNTASTFVTYE